MGGTGHGAAASLTQAEIDRRVFDLYDEYCHGRMDRRACRMRRMSIQARSMASTTTPRRASTRPRLGWRGSGRWRSSGRGWGEAGGVLT